MKNIIIKTNKEKFTSDEILKGKNFDSFLDAYKKTTTPFYKTGKFFTGIAATIIISTLLYIGIKNNPSGKSNENLPATSENIDRQTKEIKKSPFIDPPFSNLNIVPQKYIVDAAKGAILKYGEGSEIKIPQNAFIDKEGNILNGKVEITYREFHNPVDFFLSGIPMTYDSGGQQCHFESAGMCEIFAFQGSNPVCVNASAKIKVEMSSTQTDSRFNTYYLDTVKREWQFISNSEVIRNEKQVSTQSNTSEENSPSTKVYTTQLITAENETPFDLIEPVKPTKANEFRYHFTIDVDSTEFPELTVYKGVKFEVAENEKTFNSSWAKQTWTQARIQSPKNKFDPRLYYSITLSRPGASTNSKSYGDTLISTSTETISFSARPVWEGQDFINAEKLYFEKVEQYDSLLSAYEKMRSDRLKKEMVERRGIESLFASTERERRVQNQMAANTVSIGKVELGVKRSFEVNGFGIWNSDCPNSLPRGAIYTAIFSDSAKASYDISKVYLVEKGRNAMFVFNNIPFERLRFNPTKENIIWAVSSENKLLLFSVEDFKKKDRMEIMNDSCTFTMQVFETKFLDVERIQQILKI